MLYYLVVFVCTFFSFVNLAKAENILLITEENKNKTYSLEKYLYLLADPTEKLTIQDILHKEFVKIKSDDDWLSSKHNFNWVKLTVQSNIDENWLVHLHGSLVELYTPDANSNFSITKTGYLMPLMERHFEDDFGQHIYLPLKLNKGERKTFYFRISTKDFPDLMPETVLEPQICSSHYAVNDIHKRLFPHIFYVCVILGLCLYHIIVYFSSKDHNYLLFLAYSACSGLMLAYNKGISLEFLFAQNPDWNYTYFMRASHLLFAISFVIFTQHFLKIKEISLKWHHFLNFWVVISPVFYVFPTKIIPFVMIMGDHFIAELLMLWLMAILFVFQKNPFAKSYLFAHSFFFFGVIVNIVTRELGNFVSYINLGDMGMVLQQLFFAVGLAEKMNLLHEQREAVQEELIKQLEANDHLNRNLNSKLEIKVREKTLELEEALLEIRQKNKELSITLDIVKEQKHRIEQQSRDIKDSIRYASRIQRSILPSLDLLDSFLPQNFVLFKPKDIVSGDFYWFAKKDHKIIIAAADCTGHGVPGAFMSTIGNDSLNKNIEFLGITSPDLILNELHKDIRNTLKQGTESESKDGMDIAICVIDTEQQTMEYSGAMNPLYYVQHDELNVIRGTRLPIGGAQKEGKRIFEKHKIDLNTPTTFYIFSDGYQDQFGGNEGRKLMSKNFRNVLLSIKNLSMEAQKHFLDRYFTTWKGNHEQIDDILVIGVRLD